MQNLIHFRLSFNQTHDFPEDMFLLVVNLHNRIEWFSSLNIDDQGGALQTINCRDRNSTVLLESTLISLEHRIIFVNCVHLALKAEKHLVIIKFEINISFGSVLFANNKQFLLLLLTLIYFEFNQQ